MIVLWAEFYYPHFTDEKAGLKRLRNLARVAELVVGKADSSGSPPHSSLPLQAKGLFPTPFSLRT